MAGFVIRRAVIGRHRHVFETRTTQLRIQLPGHGQHRVPHGLGLQPPRRHLPEQAVVRVDVSRIANSTFPILWQLDVTRLLQRS